MKFTGGRVLIAALTSAVLATGLLAGTANAAPATVPTALPPAVSFTFGTPYVTTSQLPIIKIATARAGANSHVVVQRQVGTAAVWRSVATLWKTAGSVRVPKLGMGKFIFRVVLVTNNKSVAVSVKRSILSYGRIPVDNLYNNPSSSVYVNMYGTGTVQVNGHVLVHQLIGWTNSAPNYRQVIQAKNSSCRSISVRWAIPDNSGSPGDTATLTVVRATADPQSASVGVGGIGAATFALDSGAWNLNASATNGDTVAISASLLCYNLGGTR